MASEACFQHHTDVLLAESGGSSGSISAAIAEAVRPAQDKHTASASSVAWSDKADQELFGSMVLLPPMVEDVDKDSQSSEACTASSSHVADAHVRRASEDKADLLEELSPTSTKQHADRALRRAAALAKRAAAAVAKAEGGWLAGEVGATGWSSVERSIAASDETGAGFAPACGPAQRSVRQPQLPQVQEDRSTEFDFSITFIVPRGLEGEEFMEYIGAAFPEAHTDATSSLCFVLVPYGGDKTALLALQQLGPVEALEQARCCGPRQPIADSRRARGPQAGASGPQASFASQDGQPELLTEESPRIWKRLGRKGLPEPADEMSARSTAIAYVVRSFRSAEDAEQQLGPICSVEASYRVAAAKHRPRRFLVALHDAEAGKAVERPVDFGRPGPLGRDVLKKLQSRAVAPLPCTAVSRGDLLGHQSLVVQIVEALAAHFRPGGAAADEKYECSGVGSETTAGSSMCTTPQTSPLSSLSTPAMPHGGHSTPAMPPAPPN